MTLTERIQMNGRKANRERQQRAERRLDEIVKVAGIANDYTAEDRKGDLAIESKFAELYRLVDSDEEREAVANAFVVWQRSEQKEEEVLFQSVGGSVEFLKSNNPYWIDGQYAPADSDGAA